MYSARAEDIDDLGFDESHTELEVNNPIESENFASSYVGTQFALSTRRGENSSGTRQRGLDDSETEMQAKGNEHDKMVHVTSSTQDGRRFEDEEDVAKSSKSLFFCMTFDSPFLLNKNKAAAFEDIRFQAKFNIDPRTGKVTTLAVPDDAYDVISEATMSGDYLENEQGGDAGGREGNTALKVDHADSMRSPKELKACYQSLLEPVPYEVEGAFIMHDELLVIRNTDSVTDSVHIGDDDDEEEEDGFCGCWPTKKPRRADAQVNLASQDLVDRLARDNPTRRLLRVGLGESITVPNMYQKIIDIILRLRARGLWVRPEGMLERVQSDEDVPQTEGGVRNFYQGYRLVQHKCFISPDGDELSIKIHMPTALMVEFAESRGLFLPTNTYSYAGGRSLMYSRRKETELSKSVSTIVESGAVFVTEQQRGWGFLFTPPIKQRIIGRFIREPWRFGGCGIQVNEMMSKKIVVRHFFPLHSTAQILDKGLVEWASVNQSFMHPMRQNIRNVLVYFGEEVALYFFWIKRYNIVLSIPAIAGIILGIAGESVTRHKEIINAGYAIICVAWGAFWNMYWLRLESMFVAEHQLQDVEEQATLRDRYEGVERMIDDRMLYELEFQNPPAFNIKSDGSLVELYYPPWKRKLIRYFITYPVVLLLVAMMTGLLCLNTYFRLEYENQNSGIQYLCSFIAVVISKFFDLVFQYYIDKSSEWENCRTDEEEEFQRIIKQFFHYFLSSYFSLLSLLFWPANDTPDKVRLEALQLQMATNCAIMPFIQNITETALPWIKARYRVNRDNNPNSIVDAICKTLSGWSYKDYPPRCINKEAETLWLEAQKEPLPSMGNEYLEIAIQFGYMSMFAVTFPWAPAIAFLYNIAEIRIDAFKITYHHQRPFAKPVKSIGAWKMIYAILSIASVITNAFIVSVMTNALEDTKVTLTPEARYQSFVVYQYILIAVAVFVYIFTPITPDVLTKTTVKQSILLTRHARSENKELKVMEITKDNVAKSRERRLKRQQEELDRLAHAQLAASLESQPHQAAVPKEGNSAAAIVTVTPTIEDRKSGSSFHDNDSYTAAGSNNDQRGDRFDGFLPPPPPTATAAYMYEPPSAPPMPARSSNVSHGSPPRLSYVDIEAL